MEALFTPVLIVHIIAGYIALMGGLAAMVSAKGKRIHLLSGTWFYYCMLIVVSTAAILSAIKGGNFLLYIAIFAFYQTWTGYRSIKNKQLKFSAMDWGVLMVAGINSYFLLSSGIIFMVVFGIINTVLVIQDLRLQRRIARKEALKKMEWLRRHIGHIVGAFIATITAFLITMTGNLSFSLQYQLLVWLGPTIVFIPFSVYFTLKYTKTGKIKQI